MAYSTQEGGKTGWNRSARHSPGRSRIQWLVPRKHLGVLHNVNGNLHLEPCYTVSIVQMTLDKYRAPLNYSSSARTDFVGVFLQWPGAHSAQFDWPVAPGREKAGAGRRESGNVCGHSLFGAGNYYKTGTLKCEACAVARVAEAIGSRASAGTRGNGRCFAMRFPTLSAIGCRDISRRACSGLR